MKKGILYSILITMLTLLFLSCNLDDNQGLLQGAVTAPPPINQTVNGIYGRTDYAIIVGTQKGIYSINQNGSFHRLGLSGNEAHRTIVADLDGAVYFDGNSFKYASFNSKPNNTASDVLVGENVALTDHYSSNGKDFTFILRKTETNGYVYKGYHYYLDDSSAKDFITTTLSSFNFDTTEAVVTLPQENEGEDGKSYDLMIVGDNQFVQIETPDHNAGDKGQSVTHDSTYSYYLVSNKEFKSVKTEKEDATKEPIVGISNGYVVLQDGRVFDISANKIIASNRNGGRDVLRVPVVPYQSEDRKDGILFLYPYTTSYYTVTKDNSDKVSSVSVNSLRTTEPYWIIGKNDNNQYLVLTTQNGLFVLTPAGNNNSTFEALSRKSVSSFDAFKPVEETESP